MIITLKSFVNRTTQAAMESTSEGALGRSSVKSERLKYSKVGMWSVLLCSGALAFAGLGICIVSAARDRTVSIYGGLLLLLIGTYLMITAVKEKANLDLVEDHFDGVSAQTKDELIRSLVKVNAESPKNILGLIEKLINVVFKEKK